MHGNEFRVGFLISRPVRCSKQLLFRRWLGAQRNSDTREKRQPEQEQSVVHEMDVLHEPNSGVHFATQRWLLREFENHSNDAEDEANHETGECTALVRTRPKNRQQVDARDRRRQKSDHLLHVNVEFCSLHLYDDGYPGDADCSHHDNEQTADDHRLTIGDLLSTVRAEIRIDIDREYRAGRIEDRGEA